MRAESGRLTWTLVFLSGVFCSQWNVEYQQLNICAVRGSSVVVPCSFDHPDNLRPKKVIWGQVKHNQLQARFISVNLINTSSRFQYIGDMYHNCSLKIHQVDHMAKGKYSVRFIPNNKKGSVSSRVSPTLKVTDLNVEPTGNRTIKEGESVRLTCVNSCDGDVSSAFVWFKNEKAVSEGAALYLSNASHTSSGNYTCCLKTHTGTTSGTVRVDVEYAPKNTSVSVVDADTDITLICSSRANPRVEAYTWFKTVDDGFLVVGREAVLLPGDGGQYFCGVTNKHGSQNSSTVTLKAKAFWTPLPRGVLIVATVALLLTVTAVITLRRLDNKRTGIPEAGRGEDAQSAMKSPGFDSNQPQDRHQREEGTSDLIYSTIYFNTKRTSNREQRMDSHNDEDDDGPVIYSTVCRN